MFPKDCPSRLVVAAASSISTAQKRTNALSKVFLTKLTMEAWLFAPESTASPVQIKIMGKNIVKFQEIDFNGSKLEAARMPFELHLNLNLTQKPRTI